MRIYLDNCCYNRPYDDQSQTRIALETQATLDVRELIIEGKVELASSYILNYENSRNPFQSRRNSIAEFLQNYTKIYIDPSRAVEISRIACTIMNDGIKQVDAYHLSCAIAAKCDYFLSTDDRLLKYRTMKITLINPLAFIRGPAHQIRGGKRP